MRAVDAHHHFWKYDPLEYPWITDVISVLSVAFPAHSCYRSARMPEQRQITLQEPGRFVATTGPQPEPGAGEALVRVHRIGVCGTDLHAFAGRQPFFDYPRILGHELGVEIVEISDRNSGLSPGDLCAIEPYLNNPASQASRRGKTNCCEDLRVLGVHT
ncbi:MAG: alcohol dehydrogenase catalytic domain-containing protein, partial [Verrucomicrobiales bacterium]